MQTTTCAYDRYGNLTSVTDPLGHATIYEYDIRGRKIYEGGATYPVRYTYDVFGNKTTMMTYRNESLEPASGDVTTWRYDEASGLVTHKVYADGLGPKYEYDAKGNLTKRIWARGIITDYTYDGWNNLTNTVYSDNTPTVSLFYDAMGRQTEAHDAAGVTTFLYDSFGSLTNETVIGVAGTNTIERFWDEYGRTAGYALSGTRQTTIVYDSATARIETMQVHESTEPNINSPTPTQNSNCFVWSYHPGSDLKSSLAYPNGLTASWTCDANNKLLQVCNATPVNIISQYDYVYDSAGRRINALKSGTAFDQGDTVAYGYNEKSELTNACALVDSSYLYAYDFDDIGNRETTNEGGTNGVYSANNLNQYTLVGRTIDSAPQEEFAPRFDDDGNQTLVKTVTGIWKVQYNGENRPIRWENGDVVILMSYDRMGRRVTKNTQRFVYNGYLQIANFENSTSNIKLQTFVWDPTESIATRPLVLLNNGEIAYYFHDGNKNVSEVVSADADVVAHYEYAPFGAVSVLRGTSAALNPWRFSSEYAEDDTMTVYYNYRHYEPMTGRWLVRDLVEDLATACFIARTGSMSQRLWIIRHSSELFNQIRASKVFRNALELEIRNDVGNVYGNAAALYLYVQNDTIDKYDEFGMMAQWLAGCGIGACWGGLGGLMGSATGSPRSRICGAITGAITGCAQGAVCSSGIPQLCFYGSCIAGFIGGVANNICMQSGSLTDTCTWVNAILSTSVGCLGGLVANAGGEDWKLKLITFVLGVDSSALSNLCGLLEF